MNSILISQQNPDVERRRALAKVYALLIKLAEEAKGETSLPETTVVEVIKKEIIPESELVQLELMM